MQEANKHKDEVKSIKEKVKKERNTGKRDLSVIEYDDSIGHGA
jgi:hypothetical protein